MTATHFVKLQLHEKLLQGIVKAGFLHCMPVQEETFLHTFKGKDVFVQSQTGSGKTAAFLISIFQRLLHDNELTKKRALIIAPTRELAIQIEDEAKVIGCHLDFTIGCLYGGVGYAKQERLLSKNAHIIIGTPGRLIDFHHQGKLHFKDIGILVIDEADRMFDMGFLPDLQHMISKMPPPTQRITMLFSATLDHRVRELAWDYMNDPVEIEIEPEQVTVENITQELYHVSREEKMSLLLGILKKEQPTNALIFTNTKYDAVKTAMRLRYNGYPCEFLMGDMPQSRRSKIIEDIKAGVIHFLVATDVAARGLHINDLELVVNYDLPLQCESYVHRIGRTARVGKPGKAISLACDRYVLGLEAVEGFINMKIPTVWATDDLFLKDKSADKSFAKEIKNMQGNRVEGNSRRQTAATSHSSPKYGAAKKSARSKTVAGRSPAADKPRQAKKLQQEFTPKHRSRKPATQEERLNYYRKKYGENFASGTERPSPEQRLVNREPAGGKSLFQKIVGFFTGRLQQD